MGWAKLTLGLDKSNPYNKYNFLNRLQYTLLGAGSLSLAGIIIQSQENN